MAIYQRHHNMGRALLGLLALVTLLNDPAQAQTGDGLILVALPLGLALFVVAVALLSLPAHYLSGPCRSWPFSAGVTSASLLLSLFFYVGISPNPNLLWVTLFTTFLLSITAARIRASQFKQNSKKDVTSE